MKQIVVIATDWGPKYGGINAFNLDFCKALGNVSKDKYKITCAVPKAKEEEINNVRRDNVHLLPLGCPKLYDTVVDTIYNEIKDNGKIVLWIGHDVKSGSIANCGKKKFGGISLVFQHMDYWAYQSVKGKTGNEILSKKYIQEKIGSEADILVGVGPLLYSLAREIKRDGTTSKIIPGLADIEVIFPPPNKFSCIIFGRINKEDDSIKNGLVAAEAFGLAIKEYFASEPHIIPYLTIIGLSKDDEDYTKVYEKLNKRVKKAAGRTITINALSYLEERDQLFSILNSHHLCIMPSWHEGFGLVGWEAIAAGVPLVVSKNSGLYRHLDEKHRDCLSYIHPVDIKYAGDSKNNDEDKITIKNSILQIKHNYDRCKDDAVTLREKLLECGYTWEKAAKDVLELFNEYVVPELENPFIIEGTMPMNAISYIERQCDNDYISAVKDKNRILISGDYQTGKSSLMIRTGKIPFLVQNGWDICYLDLQRKSLSDPALFERRIFNDLSSFLKIKIQEWADISKKAGKKPLILLIDEFGCFFDNQPDCLRNFVKGINHLYEFKTNIRLVIALSMTKSEFIEKMRGKGVNNPKSLSDWYTITVTAFTQTEILKLLHLLPDCVFQIVKANISTIETISIGNPRYVQRLCYNLFNNYTEQKNTVSIIDIINDKTKYTEVL